MTPNAMEQLTPRAAEIMDLAIQNVSSGQIAKRLGLSHPYVCTIISQPNFQHRLAIRRDRLEEKIDDKVVNTTVEAANVIKENAVRAARRLVDSIDSDNDTLALKASESILDRAGIAKKVDGPTLQQQVVIINEETARTIQETLQMEVDDAA